MRAMLWRGLALIALLALAWPAAPAGATPAGAPDELCFAETGQCLSGRFRQYWEQNGGLAVFGFPITPVRGERNRDDGRTYPTQWLERARFELHAENQAPYDVLLGLLGKDALAIRGRIWQDEPKSDHLPGCLQFPTGHQVCDATLGEGDAPIPIGFRRYWERHGLLDPALDAYGRSLALFGMPLTQARYEYNSSGRLVIAQYFERARFEYDQGLNQFNLGRLGAEISANQLPASAIVRQRYAITDLAANTQAIAWAGYEDGEAVKSAGPRGQNPLTLAGTTEIKDLAVDGDFAYWTGGGGVNAVNRVALKGGPSARIAEDATAVNLIALDGDYVYWSSEDWSDRPGGIKRAPKSGGPARTIVEGQGEINALAVGGGFVYWVGGPGAFQRASINGGAPQILRKHLGHVTWAAIAPQGDQVYLAYYGFDGDGTARGAVLRMAADGGATSLLEDSDVPLGLAADERGVFWSTRSGMIKTLGADGKPRVLATGQQQPSELTITADSIYWVNDLNRVMRADRPR